MTGGEALRLWREKRGLTQAEAAAEAMVTQPTWSAWESGRRPRVEHAVTLDALTGGAVPPRSWLEPVLADK